MFDATDMQVAIGYVRAVRDAAHLALLAHARVACGLASSDAQVLEALARFRALTDGTLTPARYALMRLAPEEPGT